jgi:hypothetical protein
MGHAAFYGCTAMENISFPNVTVVGTDDSNEDMEEGVFQECPILKSISLPKIAALNVNTFMGCDSVKYISLPSVPASGLPEGLFTPCENLEWLNI